MEVVLVTPHLIYMYDIVYVIVRIHYFAFIRGMSVSFKIVHSVSSVSKLIVQFFETVLVLWSFQMHTSFPVLEMTLRLVAFYLEA